MYKNFKKVWLRGILLAVFGGMFFYAQAQQTRTGQLKLEIQAGQSCCTYASGITFNAQGVSLGVLEFTGDFLSQNGTNTWGCKDMMGTETGWAMYISMSGNMHNESGATIPAANVKISFDSTQMVGGNCILTPNSGVDVPLSGQVPLVEKDGNTASNYGKICELTTSNVKLKVVTNVGQAPGNYVGTFVIDMPNFFNATCDGLQGTFYDNETDGLTYIGNMGSAGTTQNGGKFNYKAGELITFKVGNVTLGSPVTPVTNGSVFVTDLFGIARTEVTDTNVIKVGKLLQSLDADGNSNNGITITSTGAAIFTESGNVTGLNINTKLLSLGITPKTNAQVVQHLENTANTKLQENVNVQYSFLSASTGENAEFGDSIVTDTQGNSYVMGEFSTATTIGDVSLTSPSTDMFVGKIDKTGVWSQIIQTQSSDNAAGVRPRGMAIDGSGNKYIVGTFVGTVLFGSTTLNTGGIFLTKIDTNGNRVRAKSIELNPNGETIGYLVKVDASGNSYVLGTKNNSADIFIKKINANGTIVRDKTINADPYYYNYNYGLDLDGSGNLYVAGSFRGTVSFGSTTLEKAGSEFEAFVAKMDSNGNWLWAKQSNGYWNEAHGLAVDKAGNSYIIGRYNNQLEGFGSITFGSTTFTGDGIFLAKLNTAGTVQWMKNLSGANAGYTMVSDDLGAIYAVGGFGSSISLGSLSLSAPAESTYNIFVMKIDSNGNGVSVNKFGGIQGFDRGGNPVSVYKGNISIMGYYTLEILIKDTNGNTISSLFPHSSNLIIHKVTPRDIDYYLETYPAN